MVPWPEPPPQLVVISVTKPKIARTRKLTKRFRREAEGRKQNTSPARMAVAPVVVRLGD